MSLDLDTIRVRLSRADVPSIIADAFALVGEVERLRTEVSLLQQEARIRQAINDGLAAEVDAERAAVVAWLHTEADKFDGESSDVLQTMFRCGACMSLINAADDIERGEHRRRGEK